MKIISLIIICLMFVSELCLSQVHEREMYNNTLGLKNSNISGYGFYYNRAVTDDFRLQVMGLFFYYYRLADDAEHKNMNYAFGLEVQQNITKNEKFRLYMLAGLYYYFDDDLRTIAGADKTLMLNKSMNTGIGIALEYYFKRFIFSAEVGYKFYQDNKKITKDDKAPYPVLIRETKLAAGIGVGFVF
jgi:hypothetical protein